MLTQLSNNRLRLSIALSVLLHLMAGFAFGLIIQLNARLPEEKNPSSLKVRLAPSHPPIVQNKTSKPVLATPTISPFKIEQTPVQRTPEVIVKAAEPVATEPAQESNEVTGIAFPGAISTPWTVQNQPRTPFSQARSAQQEAARAYYQQAQEAQARQQAEFQTRLITHQLQQLLVQSLNVEPLATGKCQLVEPEPGASNRLKCDSSALFEIMHKDQQAVAGMLLTLRNMGRAFNGFTVEKRGDKPAVSLTQGEFMPRNNNKILLLPPAE